MLRITLGRGRTVADCFVAMAIAKSDMRREWARELISQHFAREGIVSCVPAGVIDSYLAHDNLQLQVIYSVPA